MEAVEGADEGRVAPTVGGAVVSVGGEFGVFAANALQLSRQPAAISLRLDDGVDTVGDPAGPSVFAERGRVGRICALDVGMVEFTHVAENPLSCQLRHGLLLHSVDGDGMLFELIEPRHVTHVALVERDPLRVQHDCPRPEGDTILSIYVWVLVFHLLVQVGPQVQEFEGGAEDANGEVVITWEVLVVRHLGQNIQKAVYSLGTVPVQRLQTPRALVVAVAVGLDGEMRKHAEVSRTPSKKGEE